MDAAFLAWLTDTVSHAVYQGVDVHGAPVYGTPVTRAARVEWTTQHFTNAQGEERLSRAVVFFDGTFAVELADRLIFADGSSPAMQRREIWKDEHGQVDHLRIFV